MQQKTVPDKIVCQTAVPPVANGITNNDRYVYVKSAELPTPERPQSGKWRSFNAAEQLIASTYRLHSVGMLCISVAEEQKMRWYIPYRHFNPMRGTQRDRSRNEYFFQRSAHLWPCCTRPVREAPRLASSAAGPNSSPEISKFSVSRTEAFSTFRRS